MKYMHFLISIFLILLFMGCNKSKFDIYLIPIGFQGKVNILFDQEKGTLPTIESEKRIFEIPETGILQTKLNANYGFTNFKFYYVDSLKNRTPIKILNDESFKDSSLIQNINEIGVFYSGTSGVYGNSNDKKPVDYQEFWVSSFANLDSFFLPVNNIKFNKNLRAILEFDY